MNNSKTITKALKKGNSTGRKCPVVLTLALSENNSRVSRFTDPSKSREELPLSMVLDILAKAKEFGVVRLILRGDDFIGEPLARNDINIIIEKAIWHGFEITLWTNGDLVEQKIETLMGVSSVIIFLDGSQKFHDRNRGKGSFSYAVGAARLLDMRGIKTSFYSMIYKDTIFEVNSILETAERVGVEVAFAPAGREMLKQIKQPGLLENFPQYRKTIDALIDRKQNGKPVANSIKGLQFLREWPDRQNLGECPWKFVHAIVTARCELTMCHDFPWSHQPKQSLGDQSFDEALEQLNPPPCQDCWGAYHSEMYIETRKFSFLWQLKSLKEIV